MKLIIRRMLLLAALLLPGLTLASPAQAEDAYPNRPVRLIVPFAPGGTTDLVARVVAKKLGDELGQQIVVDNRGGAGGNVGVEAASRAEPDGYTLVMGTTSNMAINKTLYKQLPYDPVKDFVPIGMAATAPQVMVVNAKLPVANLKEFIEYAKAPGREPTFGSGGVGTPVHLAGEIFKQQASLPNMVHVPYKGSGPALADLVAGNITTIVESLPSALSYVKGGQLKAIAHTGPGPIAALPNVPAMKDAGVDLEVSGWFGLFAPNGVPKDVSDKLTKALQAALASPEVQEGLAKNGALPGDLFGADFGAFVEKEGARWGKVVEDTGIEKR